MLTLGVDKPTLGVYSLVMRADAIFTPQEVRIEITGNTYPIKDALKAAGYKFFREGVDRDNIGWRLTLDAKTTTKDDLRSVTDHLNSLGLRSMKLYHTSRNGWQQVAL